MRLRRIEAVRYGDLDCAEIAECGDGLTIVLGPNESGKSTLTALVRHVLYGFPERRMREPSYHPPTGGRHGRLTFADEQGRWVVERTEGSHRGPVVVRALHGPERPELLDELTQGVSESTFRIVFGFGLSELAEIGERSGDDIIARLYAAGAGLGVSPQDVRRVLEDRASKLYGPGAQKPLVNARARELKEVRARVRVLEDEATRFSQEQSQLRALDERLAPLSVDLEGADLRSRAIELDAQRLRGWHEEAIDLERSVAEQRRALATLERRIETLAPNEAVLESGADLDARLSELPVFSERLTQLREHEADVASLQSRLADEYRGLPEDVDVSPELATSVETWRDRLTRVEARREGARQAADRAAAAATRAEETGGAEPGPRLAGTSPLAAWVMLLLGAATLVFGLVTGSVPTWIIGVVLIAAGLAFVLRPIGVRRGGRATAHSPEELRRLREAASLAADEADAAASALDAERSAWIAWLADRHLPASVDDPAATRQLVDRLMDRERLRVERDRRQAQVDSELVEAQNWSGKLLEVASTAVGTPATAPLDDIAVIAARARAALEDARAQRAERTELERQAIDTRGSVESAELRLGQLRDQVAGVIARHDLANEDPLAAVEARASQAARELEAMRTEHESVLRERSELAGRLDSEGREAAMASERQRIETLRAQAEEAADEYLTLALATRLLTRAQERYERERQPEVTRRAGSLFSEMTLGRYAGVQVPIGGGDIVVVAQGERVRSVSELSRGTAEQLYLALRIGLIEQLGSTGADLPVLMDDVVVNFDAERREGAARAIAELAESRQVVFFTCHESTADLLGKVSTDYTRLTLDRCSL